MKKFLALTLFALALASCGGNSSGGVAPKAGDAIFTRTPYVDLSDLPERVSFQVEVEGDIQRIQVGPQVLINAGSGKFSYKDGVLTLDTSAFKDEKGEMLIAAGDQTVRIYASKTVTTSCLFVTKVLKTAADLQSINAGGTNALQGAYILGNDIDCSSISNFEPIGYSDTDDGTHYKQQFNGVFDGNGYTIKNITTKYSDDPSTYKPIYDGNYLFDDEAHKTGNTYGVFQEVGEAGVIRNVAFENVSITGRTIVGIVAGLTSGRIENVIVKENCRALMSTHFYDESCALGGIVGIVGAADSAVVEHCISLVSDLQIVTQYTDYDDDAYYEEDGGVTHIFYNGELGWKDSNDKKANNIYSGVGLTYGATINCVGKEFTVTPTGLAADFSQTHIEMNKEKDGPDAGLVDECYMHTEADLKKVSTYTDLQFDTNVWNLKEGAYPTFKAIYPYRVQA